MQKRKIRFVFDTNVKFENEKILESIMDRASHPYNYMGGASVEFGSYRVSRDKLICAELLPKRNNMDPMYVLKVKLMDKLNKKLNYFYKKSPTTLINIEKIIQEIVDDKDGTSIHYLAKVIDKHHKRDVNCAKSK